MPGVVISPASPAVVRRMAVTRVVLVALTVAACIGFSISSPYFLSLGNVVNLVGDLTLAGIVAIPATFLMMSGHVDLSVGATAAFTGVVLAIAMPSVGTVAAIALAAGTGLVIGILNGSLITVGRVNHVATTFATMALVRGLAYILPGGLATVISGFGALGNAPSFWVIGWPTLIFAVLAVLAGLLSRSGTGRRGREIGLLPRAHRLDGHSERRWVMGLYVVSALAAALVGLIRTSQLGAGLPTASIGLELTVVTAVLLGGGHLPGGRGSIQGTLLAVLLMTVVENGLSLANVTAYANQVLVAALLVVALVIDGPYRRPSTNRSPGEAGTVAPAE